MSGRKQHIWVPFTALLLLAGCASNSVNEGWERPNIEDPPPPFGQANTLPFDGYHLTTAELETLQSGTAALLTECAADYDAVITFSGDYMHPPRDATYGWGGRIGTMDENHASEYGYDEAPDGPWSLGSGIYLPDVSNLQPNLPPNTTPEEAARIQTIVFGPDGAGQMGTSNLPTDETGAPISDGGCWKRVNDSLGAPLVSALQITADVYNLALVDDRVTAAIGAWSSCMTEAGHPFDSVQGPSDQYTGPATETEIEAAVADVRCTAESKWAHYFYAVLSAYQRQAIAKDPALFDAVLASEQDRLDALSRVQQ